MQTDIVFFLFMVFATTSVMYTWSLYVFFELYALNLQPNHNPAPL